ncbi:hypothetical protein CROQUDRAFT_93651 [Cronartium quercuum f. sp. fusiforme G11]|uniref:Uncharacterized protein n=1 Tax=Cronartium quercuum f. sp. fusiforme G11 TaxID=708437 RepID=A0A9P6NJW6_9BASI|nr:hypothetical protein CROQUDRAFT_93651 [Cronartium quercuum f. sp. fusiforme G11]
MGSQPDTSSTHRPPPTTTKDLDKPMTPNDMIMSHTQRPQLMTMPQVWKQLITDKRLPRDVVVSEKLVDIMSALVFSIEDATQRMNTMGARHKASHEAMKRLTKTEARLDVIAEVGTTTLTQANTQIPLPPNPKSWATMVTANSEL